MVGGAVAALHVNDLLVLDVISELAAHAAERADRVHRPVGDFERGVARGHQCACRASLHALAARYAGAQTHGIVEVEHDLGMLAAESVADDVVDLLFAAGAETPRALDAGIQIDRNGRMRNIHGRLSPRGEARLAHLQLAHPLIQLGIWRVGLLGHVRQQ